MQAYLSNASEYHRLVFAPNASFEYIMSFDSPLALLQPVKLLTRSHFTSDSFQQSRQHTPWRHQHFRKFSGIELKT